MKIVNEEGVRVDFRSRLGLNPGEPSKISDLLMSVIASRAGLADPQHYSPLVSPRPSLVNQGEATLFLVFSIHGRQTGQPELS
jgi:hypothetical protein